MVLLFLLSIAKVDKSYIKVVAFVWHMQSYVIFTYSLPLIDPFTITLQGKMVYFAKISVDRWLKDVNETIDVTLYFTKLCHFSLQKSSTAVTVNIA